MKAASSSFIASTATRLNTFAALDAGEMQALAMAEGTVRRVGPHREIVAEGRPSVDQSIILSGWACRSRIFADGRRQILGLLLPGDLIGICRQSRPITATGVVSLTEVILCPAPVPQPGQSGLTEAYARSAALEEYYLFRQIARLGRFNALERTVDLLLELLDRFSVVGVASNASFPLPLTQEVLADTLGLTPVHVNRTLQILRRDGLLDLRGGVARLNNVEYLTKLADHRPARVFEDLV